MKWSSLLPTLWNEVSCGGLPHPIIIQLGENDLPEEKGIILSRIIMADLHLLHDMLPCMMLFWSGLLERKFWIGALTPEKMDLDRRRACKAVSQFVVFGRPQDLAL